MLYVLTAWPIRSLSGQWIKTNILRGQVRQSVSMIHWKGVKRKGNVDQLAAALLTVLNSTVICNYS